MSLVPVFGALALGLLGSGHCVAMCGGMVGVLCAAQPKDARVTSASRAYVLAYNVGRLVSYAGAGAIAGLASRMALSAMPVDHMQEALRVVVAAAMLGVGLSIAGIARVPNAWRRATDRFGAWSTPWLRRLLPLRSPLHALALGLFWSWIPCGFLYSGLAVAFASGGAAEGSLRMVAFGLGTMPAVVGMGLAAPRLARRFASRSVRASTGLAIGASGVLNLLAVAHDVGLLAVHNAHAGIPTHCGLP